MREVRLQATKRSGSVDHDNAATVKRESNVSMFAHLRATSLHPPLCTLRHSPAGHHPRPLPSARALPVHRFSRPEIRLLSRISDQIPTAKIPSIHACGMFCMRRSGRLYLLEIYGNSAQAELYAIPSTLRRPCIPLAPSSFLSTGYYPIFRDYILEILVTPLGPSTRVPSLAVDCPVNATSPFSTASSEHLASASSSRGATLHLGSVPPVTSADPTLLLAMPVLNPSALRPIASLWWSSRTL
ncbi:hypothetical protein B0H12DRAFT_518205 [Mycena haematopus]|nr:hypothetical protein B0H12DRAFT_518205 [Mycena haematopus]